MQIYDFVMAGLMYLVSGVMFWQMQEIEAPDSRVLPTAMAVVLIILATCLIIARLLKREKKDRYDFANSARGVIMLGILLLFAIGCQLFGFYVCTPFFLLAAMLFLGQRDKRLLVAVPVLTTVLVVVLFRYIFQVPLPEGTVFNIFNLL